MAVSAVQTTRNHKTNSESWTPIPELSLQLPEGVGETALVTLNVNATAEEINQYQSPGAMFSLLLDGRRLPNIQSSVSVTKALPFPYSVTVTLVVPVPLALKPQTIQAVWSAVQATVTLVGPASLSVIT